jgi:hypothetical protein
MPKSRNQALQYILNLEMQLSTSSHKTIFSGFLKVRSNYDLAGERVFVASEKQTNHLNHQGCRPWGQTCQWSVPGCKSFSLFLPPSFDRKPNILKNLIQQQVCECKASLSGASLVCSKVLAGLAECLGENLEPASSKRRRKEHRQIRIKYGQNGK